MGPTLCYLQSQIVSAFQSFRPAAPLFFLTRLTFLAFFKKYIKGFGHIDMLMMFPW